MGASIPSAMASVPQRLLCISFLSAVSVTLPQVALAQSEVWLLGPCSRTGEQSTVVPTDCVEGADGSSTIQGTPTVGRIPSGATVEKMVATTFLEKNNIVLNLHQADFSQADKIAETINDTFGPEVATPLDSTSIKVRTPEKPSQKVSFIGLLENLNFEPVTPKAKVVVNSRTGTVVIGGDVRISPAAVAHGSLSVKIQEDTKLLSEGTGTVVGTSATVAGTTATTAQETDIEVDEQPARAFVFDPGIELQTLVDALNETGTTATDMVAILEALREAGALRAELIVI